MIRKIEDTLQLEICCFDRLSVRMAAEAGVSRIEWCEDYAAGGLWPGPELIRECRQTFPGRMTVMVRPGAGGFVYGPLQIGELMRQARITLDLGADGLTFGGFHPGGAFIHQVVDDLLDLLPINGELTVHRAIDLAISPERTLEQLAAQGVHRVLMSGGPGRALEHAARLGRLQELLGPGLTVVAAGGVRPGQLSAFRSAGLRAVHSAASCRPDGQVDPGILRDLLADTGEPDHGS